MRLCAIATLAILAFTAHVDRATSTVHAQGRSAELLSTVRQALGGDAKLAALKGLTAEGRFRRSAGGRQIEGTLTLTMVRPDKFRRVEEFAIGGMVGGPTIERTSGLSGAAAWEEVATRGMGAGMQAMHGGGGGGARGPGGGMPEQLREALHGTEGMPAGVGSTAPSADANEVRARRLTAQMQRWLAAFVAEAPQPWTDAGVAESPDGKADVLEATDDTGRPLRLLVDQQTRLPLLLQYRDPKPGASGPGPDGKPVLATFALQLGGYKRVDGVLLPHRISLAVDGQPSEEWTIERFRVNPAVKADTWNKK